MPSRRCLGRSDGPPRCLCLCLYACCSDADPAGTEPGHEQEQEAPAEQPTMTAVEQRLSTLALCRTETMFIMLYAQ